MVEIINPIEKANCVTTKIFLKDALAIPATSFPFRAWMGLKDDNNRAGYIPDRIMVPVMVQPTISHTLLFEKLNSKFLPDI